MHGGAEADRHTEKKNEYEVRGLMRGTDCTGSCEPCEDLDNSFFFFGGHHL